MPRISKVLFLLLAGFVTVGVVATSFDVTAQDKKKDDKKDPKKEEKKEEKKEPFKPDPAQQEFKYVEKEKSFWVRAVAFAADGKSLAAAYRDNVVKIWDLDAKKDKLTLKGHPTDPKGLAFIKGEVFVSTGK